VLYHHERWDGSGYPSGKAGEEIPVEARVLAVADAFDAMTSDRPYRRALTHTQALIEVERCAGTQFDPEIARVFLEVFSEAELPAAAAS
jgi:HD-GYP domain-containing protein (c-di-GMP phosphodiesterase class II)